MTKLTNDTAGSAQAQPTETAHEHGADCDHDHEAAVPFVRQAPKVGRNDLCPCGSGKKFKKCCG